LPPAAAPNPYRAILRRDYPEPLVALLAFLLGIWIWDHYFGFSEGYPPGTEQVALLRIDRDLRLADAMAADPPWLRWMAGVETQENALALARKSLQLLGKAQALGPAGVEAFAVVDAETRGLPVLPSVTHYLSGGVRSEFQASARALAEGGGSWWQARLVPAWEEFRPAPLAWQAGYARTLDQLRTRALFAGSAIWLIGLTGLAFLPPAFRLLRHGVRQKSTGYAAGWPPALGLIVFMAATLAWIGFSMAIDLGLAAVPEMPMAGVVLLDAAARLLPALIAIGLLFRRPGHAVRVFGLNGRVHLRALLGLFAVLMLIDQLLRRILHDPASDPVGGLGLMDAGIWGLVFVVLSACLVAPVAEEILYRGVLFRSLGNKLGVVPAAALSAGIFAMLHFYGSYGLASVAVFGFFCALYYAGSRSLLAVIVLHSLYNLSIKLPEWIVYHSPLG